MKSKISGLETVHNADFTSLLDVVMILLFIIMVRQADSYKQAEREVREQTETQVAEMQRKIDKYENDAKDARTENENTAFASSRSPVPTLWEQTICPPMDMKPASRRMILTRGTSRETAE